MSRVPSDDSDDDFVVEITSLDTPGMPSYASDALLQGSHLAPRVRTWLTILSVVGGLLLIFVVVSPILLSLLAKKTSMPPTSHLPPSQMQEIKLLNGIAYISSSNGILRALRVKNGSLLWQRNVVGGVPHFINDTIYIDYYSNHNSTVQALGASGGTVLWTFKTSSNISPLIIDNGVAYSLAALSSQGHILTALDGRNGAELWHYTMNISPSASISIQGMQDKVYILSYGNNQMQGPDFSVLRVSDGLLLWQLKVANIQCIQNDLVCTTTNNSIFNVLSADNGHVIWHYKSPGGNGSPFMGTIMETKFFYLQTPEGWLQALRADNGAVVWTYKDPWGVAEVFPEVDGVLYLETGDGFIVALRTSDGKRLWHVRPIAPPYTFGSVQVIGGIVYTFTSVGDAQTETVAALRARDGSLLWRRGIGTSNNMNPQISNGQLFVDSGNTITVFRARDGAVLWHAGYLPTSPQLYSAGLLPLTNDIVILRLSDNVLVAHQVETGAVLWRYPRGTTS